MQIKIIKETKDTIIFEVENEDSTFFEILKKELNKIKGVEAASYSQEHPLINKLKIILKTNGTITPREALKKGSENVKKVFKNFLKEFNKIKK